MNRYYVNIPAWIDSASIIHGISKKDAIARFKHKHGFTRMPNGYRIWIS